MRASYKDVGPISSVIETRFGIAAGNTRLKAIPEWPRKYKEVKDELQHIRISLASNLHERKGAAWWEKIINKAAPLYEAEGIPRADICQAMVKGTTVTKGTVSVEVKGLGLSERTIMRYLHSEWKQPSKVEAGKKGGEEKREKEKAKSATTVVAEPPLPVSKKVSGEEAPELVGGSPPKKPYGEKGVSPPKGSMTQKAFTGPAMMLLNHLHAAGLKDFQGEIVFKREGETRKGGEPKTYTADLCDKNLMVIIEVEGEGSASKDNEGRDAYFKALGYKIPHVSNDHVEYFGSEIAEVIAALV